MGTKLAQIKPICTPRVVSPEIMFCVALNISWNSKHCEFNAKPAFVFCGIKEVPN